MHDFVVRWYCLISRNAWVPGLQQRPLFLGRAGGFQNMPAGSFCLKLPVKDNYFSTITFCTGTFDPFDLVRQGDHELQLLPLYQTLMVLLQSCTSPIFPFQSLTSSWFVLF